MHMYASLCLDEFTWFNKAFLSVSIFSLVLQQALDSIYACWLKVDVHMILVYILPLVILHPNKWSISGESFLTKVHYEICNIKVICHRSLIACSILIDILVWYHFIKEIFDSCVYYNMFAIFVVIYAIKLIHDLFHAMMVGLSVSYGVGGAVRFLVVGTIGQRERPPRGQLWMEQCLTPLKYWPI